MDDVVILVADLRVELKSSPTTSSVASGSTSQFGTRAVLNDAPGSDPVNFQK
jgi:hypothetical protein